MAKQIINIRKNSYSDSVTLMLISADIKKYEGVLDAVISMATDMNKELLRRVGLFTEEISECTENDLVIAVRCEDQIEQETITALIDEKLKGDSKTESTAKENPKSLLQAVREEKTANLAIISVPGEHAAREALSALEKGLNVMLFSDNVTVEDEIRLKEYAAQKDLLVMGPDCGTAYINGVGLCFANAIRRGNIGIAGASGTGMQELMVLCDRYGGGISNAIGVGGRDLSEAVGAIMMLSALKLLQEDPMTDVIVLVSKLPARSVSDKVMKLLEDEVSKPVVIYYATDEQFADKDNIWFAKSMKEAARMAVQLSAGEKAEHLILDKIGKKDNFGRYVRGLYCGGTLCAESYYFARNYLSKVYSNIASHKEELLEDAFAIKGNMFIDLGDDLFTRGRPHPMIDPTIRLERILECARDPETAVILLDFELGYGSHPDPVSATIDTIKEAFETAQRQGRDLKIVAYVQGTDADRQGRMKSVRMLEDAGCIIADSNIEAVMAAYECV